MFTIFTMLGEDVKAEHTTSDGRIDLVRKTEQSIFIFELKYKKSADTCVLEKLGKFSIEVQKFEGFQAL